MTSKVALHDLAEHIDVPVPPGVTAAVRHRLSRPPRRRPVLAAAAVILLAVIVISVVPATRNAVADWLGIRGVHIERRPPPVTVTSANAESRLGLGVPASMAQARRRLPGLIVPAALGAPDHVWVRPGRSEVSLVYLGDAGAVDVVVTEFAARADAFFDKFLGGDTVEDAVTVNGERGVWIEGGDHFLFVRDASGRVIDEPGRLSGNALIWEHGALTVRMEGQFTKPEALAIATS